MLKMLIPDKSQDLIGKTILLRSPVTCALEDHVCQKCYGHNANLNYDIADGISAFGSEEVSKVINQSILSAKHLLTTISEKIEFNGPFSLFFDIISGEISPRLNDNDDVDDIENFGIYINEENIERIEEFDDDSQYNTIITNGVFHIVNLVTGETFEISEKKGKELFLSEACIELYNNSTNGIIKFKDLDDDSSLFVVDIMNNELTKPLYEIIDLLNKARKDTNETINEVCQKFIELLIESKIPAYAIQSELIINRLIRDEDDVYNRPNFELKKKPKYIIMTVSKALEMNKSPLISLSFQELKRQLLSDDLFTTKTSPGYLDPFFKKKVKNTMKRYNKKNLTDI